MAVFVGLVEHLTGYVVAEAWERRADGLEFCGVTANDRQLRGAVFEDRLNNVREEVFS